jgi:hypothetical protein
LAYDEREVIAICCRTTVYPLDMSLAATILTVGQFTPRAGCAEKNGIPLSWQRTIEEENAAVNVVLTDGLFDISISPAISTFDHHLGKRITAGVYFEISARYAEKVDGEILQRATVTGCSRYAGNRGLVVAHYPSMPMTYDRICRGFQSVLLPGHHEISEVNERRAS